MDAITDMDQVGEVDKSPPAVHSKQKNKKRPAKIGDMNPDNENNQMSELAIPDVAGQMYLWDVSEEPNVVMRQSRLEQFVFSILMSPEGVSEATYMAILGSFFEHVSPRFQRTVFFYMKKIEVSPGSFVFKFDATKQGILAEQEIWS
jgi:hypothetical protein